MKDKELKEKIENSRKKESSLRWLSNQVPNNLSDSNENRMLKCIKKYSLDGANTIEELRNYLINVEDEMYEIRCERKNAKKVAEEIINEFATMLITLKIAKRLNKKIQENPISQSGYLFMFEELKNIAKKFNIKIGENL